MTVGGMGGAGASGPGPGPGPGPGGGGVGGNGGAGGDDNCSETPCKLTAPQCGCDPGQKCSWNNDNKACVADGIAQIGEACNIAQCAAGGHCLSIGQQAPLTVCKAYCDSDADCFGGGSLCALQVTNPQTMQPFNQMWCSDNCDPPTGTGCTAANAKCELAQEPGGQMRFFTWCMPSGTGTDGSFCSSFEDCANGYSCIGVDAQMNQICLQWCNVQSPSCVSGLCQSFPAPGVFVGTVEYGACL